MYSASRSALSDLREKAQQKAVETEERLMKPWLKESIDLEKQGDVEQALDVLFNHFDNMLLDGNFAECSDLLAELAVEEFSTNLLLTILTATLPAHYKLPGRMSCYLKVGEVITSRKEDSLSLLAGLLPNAQRSKNL